MSAPAKYDDQSWGWIGAIGLLSILLTFVLIVLFQAFYFGFESQLTEAKQAKSKSLKADSLLADQQGKIAAYGWLDRERKIVTIPIDRAMELVVKEQATSVAEGASGNVR